MDLAARLGARHAHEVNELAGEILARCDRALLDDDPGSAGEALDRIRALALQLGRVGRGLLSALPLPELGASCDLGWLAHHLGEAVEAGGSPTVVEVHAAAGGPIVGLGSGRLVPGLLRWLLVRCLDTSAPRKVIVTAWPDGDLGALRVELVGVPAEGADAASPLALGPEEATVRVEQLASGAVLELRAPLAGAEPDRAAPGRPAPAMKWRRAMVADDNGALRELVGLALAPMFDEIIEAGDGEDALGLLDAYAGEFDLLLLDMRMPKGDGLSVMTEARRRWPGMRVVICTGAASPGTNLAAFGAGAAAVLPKPFELTELRAVVRGVLAGVGR